eukprot:scaffold22837_cov21-Tisochrysis_lutea.AAC.4
MLHCSRKPYGPIAGERLAVPYVQCGKRRSEGGHTHNSHQLKQNRDRVWQARHQMTGSFTARHLASDDGVIYNYGIRHQMMG